MTDHKTILAGGLLAGVLICAPASADSHKFERQHRVENGHHEKWRANQNRRDDHRFVRDVPRDNRGHHNKPVIRKDFSDIRAKRKEIQQDRKELEGDYQELRKDRAELRRDIRNGTSQKEIFQDRQEIRSDLKEIAKDKQELQQDQNKLQTFRRELKADLRKK
jgi:chromosome segregation ATPase